MTSPSEVRGGALTDITVLYEAHAGAIRVYLKRRLGAALVVGGGGS